jgi:Na+/H+-dicarboxylate symporter
VSEAHRRPVLAYRVAAAFIAGAGAGFALGPRAAFLGELATSIIQILKALAAPLVFLAVAESCSRTPMRWTQGRRLITISLVNAAVAGAIAIGTDRLIPMHSASAELLRAELKAPTGATPTDVNLSLTGVLQGFVPKSIVHPFLENQVLGAVVLALLVGLALRKLKSEAAGEAPASVTAVDDFISGALRVVMTVLGWLIAIVPLAAFGIIAKVVGQSGLASLGSLGYFLGVVCIGFFLHAGVYYSALLWLLARKRPTVFFREAAEALATAFSTGSSLATLPVTLRTLQEKMGVKPETARLAAMVGTNLNHDGILLYEAAAALFIARILGVPFDPLQQALVVGISALAAFGIGGIPDAGLVTLSLVLSTLQLPLAAVPLLLPLDWLIGRLRATVNVTSDLVVAHLLEAWDRKQPAKAPADTPRSLAG